VKKLCKGGDNLHNNGFGWLVFLCADKKEKRSDNVHPEVEWLSSQNKKFIDYKNDKVLLPFIQDVCKELGWNPGQPVPEWLTSISWSDGDIPQLQTLMFEARRAIDDSLNIICNKHSAAATGTQQLCDLSPVFRLLKEYSKHITAKNDVAATIGLPKIINDLFSELLPKMGLNLDPRKKRALMDFLKCIPRIMEYAMKKEHMQRPFVEAGMTDEETGVYPNFDALIGTCKRWVSSKKEIGIKKVLKTHYKNQVPCLARIQIKEGEVSYENMGRHGIPRGELCISIYSTNENTVYCLLKPLCSLSVDISLSKI